MTRKTAQTEQSSSSGESRVRPPIVAVLGHVDHGKSTLLDYIRKANTVAGEAGGITQHVAAYEVEHVHEGEKKRMTFIDTPGHAAFQAIRARGANIADIAILVVAADDGVKAQTLEALGSIRAAGIPFVVAINKIDKPNADLARTQGSLLENHVYLEQLGGDVPWAAVSAKTGQGVPELLDLVLLVAELNEYTADPTAPAEGYVIEAHRDPKRGIAATLIITNGTLGGGSFVLAGSAISPVRIMEDHAGKSVREASFSSPILLIGFDELPAVGASFRAYASKRSAEHEREKLIEEAVSETSDAAQDPDRFALPVIVKADVSGSLEAIEHEVAKISDERSFVRLIHSGIGAVTEDDVKAATASKGTPAVIVGFNTAIDAVARERARQSGITIESFDIIYKMTERLEELMRTTRPKRTVETKLGRAHILKVFSRRKSVHLVGGRVFEGHLVHKTKIRVVRKGEVLGEGLLLNMQTNRQNTARVEKDSEFGAEVEADCEIAQNDVIECFTTVIE